MSRIINDLRFGVHSLGRKPNLAPIGIVALGLALGIGENPRRAKTSGTLTRCAIAAWLALTAQAVPSQPSQTQTQTQAQPSRTAQAAARPTQPAPTPTDGSWLAEERGPFATDTVEEVWVDGARDEAGTAAPGDKRHLTVQIWYPPKIAEGASKASYALRIEDYDQTTKDTWGVAGAWPTNSVLGAELSSQRDRYPVVLYSHGFGQPSFSGTFQTEFLASHGYIVLSIGHTGTDGRVLFPDGYVFEPRAEEPEPPAPPKQDLTSIEMYRLSGQRPAIKARRVTLLEDIRFVLDRLEEIEASPDQRFHGRLDVASIGGLGFSNGGALFFEATLDEPRIAAAANMDGGLNGLRVLTAGARKPILLVQASNNYPRVLNGEADAGMEEFFVEVERETWQMLRLSGGDWYKATLRGTQHPYFSDAYLITSAPAGLADPRRVHLLANRLTLAFFDRYLKHAAMSPLLSHEETPEGLQLVSKLRDP